MYTNRKVMCLLLELCLLAGCAGQPGLLGLDITTRHDRKEYVQARDLFNAGHYQEAITQLSAYIYKTKNVKRREVRAYRLLGQSYEQLGNLSKALETYQEALEFHPNDVPLLLAAASLYRRTELNDRSLELYEHALSLQPNNQDVLAGVGEIYLATGYYAKARSYYEQLFKLNPQAQAVHRARYAQTFYQQKDYANAFINVTMALSETPDNPDFWLLSAKANRGLGRFNDALADLDTALLLAPNRADLEAYRALWLHQAKRYAESDWQARQILDKRPGNELALFVMAMNASSQGKHQQAKTLLQQIRQGDKETFIHRFADSLFAPPAIALPSAENKRPQF